MKNLLNFAVKDIPLNFLYESPEIWRRFDLACDKLPWSRTSLVQQCVQAFFKVHGGLYEDAAIADAQARGMEESNYYKALLEEGSAGLPPYLEGEPDFPRTPLQDVPFEPKVMVERRRYSGIRLGDHSGVLLEVACIVAKGTFIEVASQVVRYHFERYWEQNYLPQLEKAEQRKFKLEKKDDSND